MAVLGSELKVLTWHGSIYAAGSILTKMIGFLMIPVYTRFLTTTEFGEYALIGITIEVISIVIGMGVADAVYRYYFDTSEDSDPDLVVSTACVGVPIAGGLFILLLCSQSHWLAALTLDSSDKWMLLCIALGELWLNQQMNLVYTYLRITESSKAYVIVTLAKTFVSLSMNIYFVAFLKWGVMGLLLSNLISAGIFTLLCYPFLLRKVGLRFSLSLTRKLLRYSLPIVPANLASFAINVSDRYFIKSYFSIAQSGIYSLGYKFGNVNFYLIRVPFSQIWGPRRYTLYKEEADPAIYARVATYLFFLMVFSGMGIGLFMQDIIKLISPPEYWSAAHIIPAVAFCYAIYSLDTHIGFGINIAMRTEFYGIINVSNGVLNIILNFALIPRFGMWGAIGATFICFVVKIIALQLIASRLFYIPFEWLRMLSIFLIAALVCVIRILSPIESLLIGTAVNTILVFAYLLVLWVTGIVAHDEKAAIIKYSRLYLFNHFVRTGEVK